MAATRKVNTPKRPQANKGQRKAAPVADAAPAPVSDVGAHGDAPAVSCGARVASVRSRRDRFQRCGIVFTNTTPTIVTECEVGAAAFDRILNEPQLRCEPQE